METKPIVPCVSNNRGGEEDHPGPQMLEIIDGASPGAPQTLDEIEGGDVWSYEDGDDSVFYSDEEQVHEDKWVEAPCNLHRLVNSVAEEETMEMETTREDVSTSNGGHNELVQKLKEHQQAKGFTALKENESDGNETGVKEEPALQDTHTSPTEESFPRIEDEEKASQQQASVDLLTSKNKEQTFHTHTEIHQHPSPAYSTLPLIRKTGVSNVCLQTPSEPRTPSKYSTLSYRKIRKGNTRQKIQDFEYRIMKL